MRALRDVRLQPCRLRRPGGSGSAGPGRAKRPGLWRSGAPGRRRKDRQGGQGASRADQENRQRRWGTITKFCGASAPRPPQELHPADQRAKRVLAILLHGQEAGGEAHPATGQALTVEGEFAAPAPAPRGCPPRGSPQRIGCPRFHSASHYRRHTGAPTDTPANRVWAGPTDGLSSGRGTGAGVGDAGRWELGQCSAPLFLSVRGLPKGLGYPDRAALAQFLGGAPAALRHEPELPRRPQARPRNDAPVPLRARQGAEILNLAPSSSALSKGFEPLHHSRIFLALASVLKRSAVCPLYRRG